MQLNSYYVSISSIALLILLNSCSRPKRSDAHLVSDTLTVLSFNILYGGDEVDFNKTVELIQRVNPDVAGIQEAEGNIPRLASALGWTNYDSRLHVLSKYPILTNEMNGWYFGYIEVRPGMVVAVSNIHLPSDPYGPELVRDGLTRKQVLDNEIDLRYHELDAHLKLFDSLRSLNIPIIVTGDFNTPSHRDWKDTTLLIRSHMHYSMEWPVTQRLEQAGFVDTYRAANSDVLAKPGLTWTPGYPNAPLASNETHDRIDFIWAAGVDTVLQSTLAGENGGRDVSINIEPYPSDHRAVITKLVVTPTGVASINKSYHDVGHSISDSLHRTPQLLLTKATVPSGEVIEIEWSGSLGNRFDWLAVYPESVSPKDDYYKSELATNYLVYSYTYGKRSGKLQFNEHSRGGGWPLKPGKYKIHFLQDDGYTSFAEADLEITLSQH